jgi:hypothetical protein
MACLVLMFVYIDIASQVKSLAFGGKSGSVISSSFRAKEELIYEGIVVEYCFKYLSTHRPRPCRRLPLILTIGRVFHGVLWTFAVK